MYKHLIAGRIFSKLLKTSKDSNKLSKRIGQIEKTNRKRPAI